MSEKSITVHIATRPYNLIIKEEEEDMVKNASDHISKKINDFSLKYNYKDMQDLLAMVLLETVAIEQKNESIHKEQDSALKTKLSFLNQIVSDSL